jgi:hypothetical protein
MLDFFFKKTAFLAFFDNIAQANVIKIRKKSILLESLEIKLLNKTKISYLYEQNFFLRSLFNDFS